MRVSTGFNNFSRGKADKDINGRYDLPIYTASTQEFKNFYSNFKGNAIFRQGFEDMVKYQDCVMLEFKFNKTQDYILVFTNLLMKVLTYDGSGNFGWLQNGGSDFSVATPWTLAQAKQITERSVAQNADVMYVVHPDTAPYKITRTAADTFTVATFTRTADPFTSANNYPSCVRFYKGFLYYGSTNNETTTIWRSKGGSYDDLTVGTGDNDGLKFAISDLTERILWLAAGNNSLIGGSSQSLIAINGGTSSDAITPTTISAYVTETDGSHETQPIRKDDLLFYINSTQRNVNYFSYNILTESFESKDANILSYDITDGKLSNLQYKKDKNNLIWTIRNGDLLSLNFNQEERIVGWHEHTTNGTFEDIVRLNNDNADVELFALIKHGSDYHICRMSEETLFPVRSDFYGIGADEAADKEAFYRKTAEVMKELIYTDISTIVKNYFTSTITYDSGAGTITSSASDFVAGDVGKKIIYKTATGVEVGVFKITAFTSGTVVSVDVELTPHANSYASWYKTFDTITGLTDYIGETMAVVGDGGYIGDFIVDGSGEIDMAQQVTVAVVGFSYEGLIQTFNLGFPIQGTNTQTTSKAVYHPVIRFVSSAGGQVGTSLYRMKDIQNYDPSGYYGLPPLPMDGDRAISFTDDSQKEKVIYIKQNKPLPLKITALMIDTKYGTRI